MQYIEISTSKSIAGRVYVRGAREYTIQPAPGGAECIESVYGDDRDAIDMNDVGPEADAAEALNALIVLATVNGLI